MSNEYEVTKQDAAGTFHSPFEVVADDYEIEMCGAVSFYHKNAETRKILSIAPGSWARVVDVLNKP